MGRIVPVPRAGYDTAPLHTIPRRWWRKRDDKADHLWDTILSNRNMWKYVNGDILTVCTIEAAKYFAADTEMGHTDFEAFLHSCNMEATKAIWDMYQREQERILCSRPRTPMPPTFAIVQKRG
jgi:hypothetical protein